VSEAGARIEVRVPDLGGFKDVAVIEVLVRPGDEVALEAPLITLESDKATMDIPSSAAGKVVQVLVQPGDKVNTGTPVAIVESSQAAASPPPPEPRAAEPYGGEPYLDTVPIRPLSSDGSARDFDVVVIGAGPGGYAAAFRAADLGLRVGLVERRPTLGGVCLNVGCIPSKALLHAARVIEEAHSMAEFGIRFGEPQVDAGKLRAWKDGIVAKMTGNLSLLAKQRKVAVLQGSARFAGPNEIELEETSGSRKLSFTHCIVAAGSEPVRLPGWPDDPRIIDSTGALELGLPERLLVVGGGIIGLEMATVYDALGVKVSVAELTDGLIPGCDRDLVRPLERRIRARYERIMVGTKVTGVEAAAEGLRVSFEGAQAPPEGPQVYGKVLVAVGRTPNGKRLAAEAAGIKVDERGFIPVDRQMRTNVPHIFAIGDVAGQPMLAHKATHEGKVAAEAAAGHKSFFDARVIPSVAYTDPEIAWAGLTELEAKARNVAYEKAAFPWAASGRSLAINRNEGSTRLLFDPQTRRILGAGIVGTNAGDLISELALAIEMGADAADIGLTIHPHPTLSETVGMAAEAFEGTLTDLYLPKKKKNG
jgi:dihydrolipoamide dehydrogenase